MGTGTVLVVDVVTVVVVGSGGVAGMLHPEQVLDTFGQGRHFLAIDAHGFLHFCYGSLFVRCN